MTDIITIVGARPQFVKAAVVSKALKEAGISEQIIHTGQHYDARMSAVFFDELGLPAPSVNLAAGSGLHGKQTADMLEKLEAHLIALSSPPSFMMVYGDTNSTLAGALAAAKLHIPVIHIEAGLRSFNRKMPEEINRVVTDHLSTLLFCSSDGGLKQLASEGITEGVHVSGDVMYDAVRTFSEAYSGDFRKQLALEEAFTLPDRFLLFTLHRPSNTDSDEALKNITGALSETDLPVIWPVHPRVRSRLDAITLPKNLRCISPVSYLMMLQLLKACEGVLTDSGGLQKEAYWLQKPCITLREETEWTETLHGGWNVLTGPDPARIRAALSQKPGSEWKTLYGNGRAAESIATIISDCLNV